MKTLAIKKEKGIMANRNEGSRTDINESPSRTDINEGKFQVPANYQDQSGEIKAFWDGQDGNGDDIPLHFIPRYAKLMDNAADSRNPSVLIIGEAVDPFEGYLNIDEERETVEVSKNDIIGVWGSAGMKALVNLRGVPVFMYRDGEKDVGRPQPMKVYKILSQRKGKTLLVTEDLRKDSKGTKTFLTMGGNALPDAPF